jgi:MFS family permease
VSAAPAGRLRLFAPVASALAAVFLLSQIYRYLTAVVAPEIANEFGLSPGALGGVGATFFFTFAACQLPVGVALDRWGAQRVIAFMQIFAVAGLVLASQASSAAWLTVAMMLLGLGACSNLSGSLWVATRWLPADRFATMMGLLVAFGGLGHILSTSPIAFVIEALGWRGAYALVAGLQVLGGIGVIVLVRDVPPWGDPAQARGASSLLESVRGVWDVVRTPGMTRLFAAMAMGPSIFFVMRGLWAGPYLSEVHALVPTERGHMLLVMSLGLILGNLIYGPMDRRFDTRKRVVMAGAILLTGTYAVFAALPHPELWLTVAIFFALGLVSPYDVAVFAHGRALVPARLAGRTITTLNFALFGGISCLQALSGYLIGALKDSGFDPEAAFRILFACLAALGIIGLAIYARSADAKPSRDAA